MRNCLFLFLALTAPIHARTVWPDTTTTRDTTDYYVAKVDTVHTTTVGDTIRSEIVTSMARKIKVRIMAPTCKGDTVLALHLSAKEFDALRYVISVGLWMTHDRVKDSTLLEKTVKVGP